MKAVFCATLVATTPAFAQSSFSALQEQAEAALVTGQPTETLRLAQEMLRAEPESFIARYLLALAQADLNDAKSAALSGARAYAVATTEDTRFEAARFVAGAHFQAGQYTRSAFWLRRAANHTQSIADQQFIAEAYATTVATNPLSFQVTASVAPTDNINDGSDDGVLQLEGIDLTFVLPEDRRSLSGIAFSASTAVQYRLSQDTDQLTQLTGAISGDAFVLSDEARALLASSPNPDVRSVDGGDFATVTARFGINRLQNNISPLGSVRFGAALGSYWEAGQRRVDFRDLSLEQIIPLSDASRFQLSALVRKQDALTPDLRDSTTYDLTGTFDRFLTNHDQLQFSLMARRNDAGPESSYNEYQIGINYLLAEPVFGALLSTSLNVGLRRFEEFTTTLDGRDDHFILASATALFEDYSYYGFSPSVTVSASRTNSTAEEISTSAVKILFGVASNF
jgi:hypothetical protein